MRIVSRWKVLVSACVAVANIYGATWASEYTLANIAYDKGDYSGAEQHDRAALSEAESFAQNDTRLEATLTHLGAVLQARGECCEAEAFLRRALRMRESQYGKRSIEMAEGENNLAAVLRQDGHLDEAHSLQTEALATAEQVLEANNAGLVPFLTLAALSERDAAHYERAAELLKRARVLVENNGKADPRQLMQVWKYLGTVYRAAGRFDEAEEAYQKLESLSEANFGADKLDTANALTNVGGVLCDRKFYAQARPYLVRALEIYGRIHDEDSPSFVAALQMLSTADLYLGQANSAEQRVLLAIEILNRQKRSGELLAIAYNNLGQVYATEGRNKEAERAILRAKEIWIAIDGPGSPKAATALSNLGALYVRQGKYKKGEALYSESAAIDAKNFGTASIDYARDLNRLGVLYNSRKRFAESEDVLRKALEIDSKKLGDNSPILAEPYLNLGSSLQGQRRREEALECYKRGVDIMTKAGQRDAPNMASILEGYSALLREMEQWSDAEKISTEALGIRVREKIKGETYR